jgi:hypothetical protein
MICIRGIVGTCFLWPKPIDSQSQAEKMAAVEQSLKDHMEFTANGFSALDKRIDIIDARQQLVLGKISTIEARSQSTHEAAIGIFTGIFLLVLERINQIFIGRRNKQKEASNG